MSKNKSKASDLNGGEGLGDPGITLLWSRTCDGDEVAFSSLYDLYIGRLRLHLRGRLTNQDLAEGFEDDLANESMMSVWQGVTDGRFGSVTNREELWFTMMSVANSRALDRRKYLRRKKRMFSMQDQMASLFQRNVNATLASDAFENLEVWAKFTKSLPNDVYREIVRMKMEGMELKEIAAQLDSVPRSVRRKLRIVLCEWEAFVVSQNYF